MNTHNQQGRTGRTGYGGANRVVSVGLPDPHEGVRKALRATYGTVRQDLPDDMIALLRQMDRH